MLDAQGRILGWFSWEPDHAMSDALGEMRPLAILTAIFLVGFAGVALWQVRRTVRELGASEQLAWQLAHEDMLTGLPNHRKMIEQIDAVIAQRAAWRRGDACVPRPRRPEGRQRRATGMRPVTSF